MLALVVVAAAAEPGARAHFPPAFEAFAVRRRPTGDREHVPAALLQPVRAGVLGGRLTNKLCDEQPSQKNLRMTSNRRMTLCEEYET